MRDADGRDVEQRTDVDRQASVGWVIAAGPVDQEYIGLLWQLTGRLQHWSTDA